MSASDMFRSHARFWSGGMLVVSYVLVVLAVAVIASLIQPGGFF